ncbi:DUF6707 family protein [Arthrobacter sp. M4]|uniref:DUF6707 family protein n=1 Tax=Arthrobacter sp. M4 TaxID=218160 RepID=UPI001CDB8560|nr:DUF6707 family protein [Arthrobacter sp. M4]MCA4134382.1 hypothetical protein [Arthrobacter sp. M4]
MTHSPAAQEFVEKEAGALRVGDQILLPGGSTAQIGSIDLESDDYGAPALLVVSTDDGGRVSVAVGSRVSVVDVPAYSAWDDASVTGIDPGIADSASPEVTTAEVSGHAGQASAVVPPLPPLPPVPSGPSEDDFALIPEPSGTPESVVEQAAAAHPGRNGVGLLSERLTKGINTKSGSCLRDLSDLAYELYVVLKDPSNAISVANLLNVLPFDGNPGRWTSIERSLSLSAYIAREEGRSELAELYEKLLRAPEAEETDPFKARMNAKVRQRALNEPNLYDKEIFRAMDNSNHEAEREWRMLRLEALLFLRAHGGSETIAEPELVRRIGNELEAVRG